MSWLHKSQVAVIDNGTGYTKMGWSGNYEPSYIIPTAIAAADEQVGNKDGVADLDFVTGPSVLSNTRSLQPIYPMRQGIVEDWNTMERLWQRCFFEYLRCDPEEHHVLLTEPPLNPPENREMMAEVMFETFNVPGMNISVQAVLSLMASWSSAKSKEMSLTGLVIDSGDGVTHVIPVSDGYVMPGAIKHIPLAGRDITQFIQRMLRDRGEPIPPEESLEIAKKIKEEHCYVGQDMVKEYSKFDADPSRFKKETFKNSRTKAPYTVDVGYEQFLGPEMFFNPEIASSDFTKGLPQVVDESILQCPIDTRRKLYSNIVLSGGSTMFRNFDKRLKEGLQDRVDTRVQRNLERIRASGSSAAAAAQPERIKVRVVSHDFQRIAVWFGGSMLADDWNKFSKVVITKEQYQEEGPRCARESRVFHKF